MLTGVWSFVWVVYVFLYTIVAVTIYFIEIWSFENENDDDINNDEVIYVINFFIVTIIMRIFNRGASE